MQKNLDFFMILGEYIDLYNFFKKSLNIWYQIQDLKDLRDESYNTILYCQEKYLIYFCSWCTDIDTYLKFLMCGKTDKKRARGNDT